MLEIRSLAGVGWEPLAAAFNAAFSDYVVPMSLTADGLAATQHRRGYAADASFGAFEGDRLVGFVLTCLEGDRAYNSGTGVAPSHRRTGLARRLVEAVIASVRARSYVLEVIETNTPAVALYGSLGFAPARQLQVWTYARREPDPAPDVPVIAAPDASTFPSGLPPVIAAIAADADADAELPWQNSLASIRRATEPWVALGDERGAAILFPGSADLPFLCVRRAERRRGHGTRLLAAAAAHAGRPLRMMVDDRDAGIAAFLEAAGAARYVRQLELIRELC